MCILDEMNVCRVKWRQQAYVSRKHSLVVLSKWDESRLFDVIAGSHLIHMSSTGKERGTALKCLFLLEELSTLEPCLSSGISSFHVMVM